MAVGKTIYQGVARGKGDIASVASANVANVNVASDGKNESVTGLAVSELHMASGKRPYALTGFYERTNPETGKRERLGPGEIVMLTPKKAKEMGAIPVEGVNGGNGGGNGGNGGSAALHNAADRNLSRGDEE